MTVQYGYTFNTVEFQVRELDTQQMRLDTVLQNTLGTGVRYTRTLKSRMGHYFRVTLQHP